MNSKNLDAIKRMVIRLQSIRETEFLLIPVNMTLGDVIDALKEVVNVYDPIKNDTSQIRTD